MSPDNLSPVTEAEFMSFAQRVATTLVSYSKQQGDIDSLKASLEDTKNERDHLRSENTKLNQDVGEITTLADGYSRERDDAMRRVADLEGKLRYQEEMAIQRDAKVTEVQGENTNLKTRLDQVRHELDVMDNSHKSLSTQLADTGRDRDHWQQAANEAERNLKEVSTKLDKIPLPIRAHFTGESLETTKPEPQKVDTSEHGERYPDPSKPRPWAPPVEMKPVQEEAPTDHPEWMKPQS